MSGEEVEVEPGNKLGSDHATHSFSIPVKKTFFKSANASSGKNQSSRDKSTKEHKESRRKSVNSFMNLPRKSKKLEVI